MAWFLPSSSEPQMSELLTLTPFLLSYRLICQHLRGPAGCLFYRPLLHPAHQPHNPIFTFIIDHLTNIRSPVNESAETQPAYDIGDARFWPVPVSVHDIDPDNSSTRHIVSVAPDLGMSDGWSASGRSFNTVWGTPRLRKPYLEFQWYIGSPTGTRRAPDSETVWAYKQGRNTDPCLIPVTFVIWLTMMEFRKVTFISWPDWESGMILLDLLC